MQGKIPADMSKLQEEPTQQAEPVNQAQDQQLAKIMEEEMTHHKQVSVLSCIHLQQAEEEKAQSQEVHSLSALVEQQQDAIKNYQVLIVFLGNQEPQHHSQNPS